tara:strand:+ start:2416 stop:2574 length:159 start_codon:yes stop_codon:yes gene_type:complete
MNNIYVQHKKNLPKKINNKIHSAIIEQNKKKLDKKDLQDLKRQKFKAAVAKV